MDDDGWRILLSSLIYLSTPNLKQVEKEVVVNDDAALPLSL